MADKCMISQHMNGLSDDEILTARGKAIEKMANCKAIYFCKGWAQHRGCRIEHQIALEYGHKCFYE